MLSEACALFCKDNVLLKGTKREKSHAMHVKVSGLLVNNSEPLFYQSS